MCQHFCRSKVTYNQTVLVQKKVMGFNVPMAYSQRMDVHQTSEELICHHFEIQRLNSLFACFDMSVKIAFVVVHHNIEKLLSFFSCEVCAQNSHCEITLQHFYHLNLSVLVFRILEDPLNRNPLSCSLQLSLKHLTKCSLSNKAHQFHITLTHVLRSGVESPISPSNGHLIRTSPLIEFLGPSNFTSAFLHSDSRLNRPLLFSISPLAGYFSDQGACFCLVLWNILTQSSLRLLCFGRLRFVIS